MKKIAILSLSLTLAAAAQAQTAEFDYFKYAGNDARFNVEIDKTHQYYNPVLAGFKPAFSPTVEIGVFLARISGHPFFQVTGRR